MINPKCYKCKGTGEFPLFNYLTGHLIKVPCLCPLRVSKADVKLMVKRTKKLGDILIKEYK